jgi:hypothetical protein
MALESFQILPFFDNGDDIGPNGWLGCQTACNIDGRTVFDAAPFGSDLWHQVTKGGEKLSAAALRGGDRCNYLDHWLGALLLLGEMVAEAWLLTTTWTNRYPVHDTEPQNRAEVMNQTSRSRCR